MVAEDAEIGEVADELEEAAAGVYRGPLEEFVARRDALVAELRTAGRRDDANTVKRWRKPTRTAWALDAAVFQERANAERLATAVATMVAAQSGRGDVRAASERLRLAVRELASAAAHLAADEGHPVDRAGLVPAVMAVIAEPDALTALRAGRLTDIPAPKELGLLGQAPPGVQPAATAVGTDPRGADTETTEAGAAGAESGGPGAPAVSAAREALQQAEDEAAAAREQVEAADRAVTDGEAALDDANEQLRRAEQEARTARDQLREAQQTAKAARQQVRQAERAAASARAKLDALTR